MSSSPLYLQLSEQLSQFITPKDRRHLQVFSELIGAILMSGSACMSHWAPFLTHRACKARSHLERISYFLKNSAIDSETFYEPLLQFFLQAWQGKSMTIVVATHNTNRSGPQSSEFWDQIKCNYPITRDQIICNWDHIIYNWDRNHRFETELNATVNLALETNALISICKIGILNYARATIRASRKVKLPMNRLKSLRSKENEREGDLKS
jgi:hypothetical protein